MIWYIRPGEADNGIGMAKPACNSEMIGNPQICITKVCAIYETNCSGHLYMHPAPGPNCRIEY